MAGKRTENIGLYLIVGAIVLVAVLLVVLLPSKHNWTETLRTNAEEPYDLTVFQALLDSSTTKPIVITKAPVTEELKNYFGYNYFFLGNRAFIDSAEVSALFEFAERGNTVFLCSPTIPQTFFDECDSRWLWLGGSRTTWSETAKSQVHEYSKEYEFSYKGPLGSSKKEWSYIEPNIEDEEEDKDESGEEVEPVVEEFFSEHFEDDTTYVIEEATYTDSTYAEPEEELAEEENDEWVDFEQLGGFYNDNGRDSLFGNFFVANVGKGNIYIHCNPIMFSNYYLTKEPGFVYTNEVLSFLDNRPVIWDNYHQSYQIEQDDYEYQTNTPLRFIFQHPALKYAWLTLVASAILFLIFRSKREQRIIPIIPPVENTSMAFAKSLGVLYHQATSGRFLAVELMRMFDNFNRRQYRYNRNRKREESASEIAKKARVPLALVEEIILLERQTVYNPVSKITQVFVLYNRLEEYYKQAKK